MNSTVKCDLTPCDNGGVCSPDATNGFTCTCVGDFTGRSCDMTIDDCLNMNCNNGTCVDGVGTFTCECEAGYTGQFCEEKEVAATTSDNSPSSNPTSNPSFNPSSPSATTSDNSPSSNPTSNPSFNPSGPSVSRGAVAGAVVGSILFILLAISITVIILLALTKWRAKIFTMTKEKGKPKKE